MYSFPYSLFYNKCRLSKHNFYPRVFTWWQRVESYVGRILHIPLLVTSPKRVGHRDTLYRHQRLSKSTIPLSHTLGFGEAATARREAPREKNYLWSQELLVSFPRNFRNAYLTKPVWNGCVCFFFIDSDS